MKPLSDVFGPWPVYRQGLVTGAYDVVYAIGSPCNGIDDRDGYVYWHDDSHIIGDSNGDDLAVRFSASLHHTAGFATAEDALLAFERRGYPYIEKNKEMFSQALRNNIRIHRITVAKEKPKHGT